MIVGGIEFEVLVTDHGLVEEEVVDGFGFGSGGGGGFGEGGYHGVGCVFDVFG